MSNRIYTFCENVQINAGLFSNYAFNIPANNRELKIKSITLDWYVHNNTTGKRVPLEQCTDAFMRLEVGSNVTGENFSSQFIQTSGMGFTYKGNCIFLTQPCSLQFDSFVVTNILPFRLFLNNSAAATNFMNYFSLLVEVEEKIIWNAPPVETFRIEE